MAAKQWRLLNTGFISAAENMALDEALLTCRDRDLTPDTFRFMFFKRDTVLVGYHQCVDLEVDTDFCAANQIEINRRVTGGGAILMQPCHIGFEIICQTDQYQEGLDRRPIYRIFSEPIVSALKSLGLNAAYRPLNDIEINGKKVSGTGGADGNSAFLFHGSILLDMNLETMIKALKIPIEKISDKALNSIRERMTTVNHELGKPVDMNAFLEKITDSFSRALKIDFHPGSLTAVEEEIYASALPRYQSQEWIHKVRMPESARQVLTGNHKAPGGLVRAVIVKDKRNQQIQSLMISGDFFTSKPEVLREIEARVKGVHANINRIRWIISQIFHPHTDCFPDVAAEDFVQAIAKALDI